MGLTVLIVDDNQPFLEAARGLLERQGLDVLDVASTTTQALVRLGELRPDIVLVDINLGAENGFDLARQVTDDGLGLRSTVIMMSTDPESDFTDVLALSKAAGFMAKSELSGAAVRAIYQHRER